MHYIFRTDILMRYLNIVKIYFDILFISSLILVAPNFRCSPRKRKTWLWSGSMVFFPTTTIYSTLTGKYQHCGCFCPCWHLSNNSSLCTSCLPGPLTGKYQHCVFFCPWNTSRNNSSLCTAWLTGPLTTWPSTRCSPGWSRTTPPHDWTWTPGKRTGTSLNQ